MDIEREREEIDVVGERGDEALLELDDIVSSSVDVDMKE